MPTFGSRAGVGTSVATAELEDGAVTNAKVAAAAAIARSKLANLSGPTVVVGRKTAGAGAEEELTVQDIFDAIGTEAQGDLIYFNGTDFVLLPAGTSGQFLKTLGAGANPTWSDLTSPWTTVKKTADETITSSTTFQDDNELLFNLEANTYYTIRGTIYFLESANPGIKFQFTGPASPNAVQGICYWCDGGDDSTGITIESGNSYTSILPIITTGSGNGVLHFELFVKNGANAGNLTLQWAQQASDAQDTTVYKGSYIEYIKAA